MARRLAEELGRWFAGHAAAMDAALAKFLHRVAYTPRRGVGERQG